MHIPDNLFPGLSAYVGPVLIYLDRGEVKRGFPLRKDEFVTSLKTLEMAKKKAGIKDTEAE
ncbi:hypothetical protein [Klebsiella aerogenes]|uniref:hypothetical protein n=1 Tax=Klebsiella aerogenes TaxID=548 RepID=UPI0014951BE0|nr:hypothetical protein [Klebsiella aerogenes]NPD58868.1 hypothetical protein [Klebsiella aerogenes]